MILLFSLVIAVLFGTGAYLMLVRDLYRVVAGIVLVSNAANLFLMAAALTRGVAPIHPIPDSAAISDPLVQALTLTAIVITFAVCALLLSLVVRVYRSYITINLEDIAQTEVQEEHEQEREIQ
jgi:multicomponent Na+:H+ antiporter subunit C